MPSGSPPEIAGVATSIAAFVGYTAQGIDNRAEKIASFADFERLFGGLSADSEVSYGVRQFFANGGTDAYVVRVSGTGIPGTADLIGDPLASTGIYALDNVDLFNLLSIPDATRAATADPHALDPAVDPNSIYAAAIDYCSKRRAMLLIDVPPDVNDSASAMEWKTAALAVHDANGAAFFPRLRLSDALDGGRLRSFAQSPVVAGLYARNDAIRGVWKAPAGVDLPPVGVQELAFVLNEPQAAALNSVGLNCFRTLPGRGPLLMGSRTLVGADADASEWKFVPIRRFALFIEESVSRGSRWAQFEPTATRCGRRCAPASRPSCSVSSRKAPCRAPDPAMHFS
jgi:phage tail sheath protein FI